MHVWRLDAQRNGSTSERVAQLGSSLGMPLVSGERDFVSVERRVGGVARNAPSARVALRLVRPRARARLALRAGEPLPAASGAAPACGGAASTHGHGPHAWLAHSSRLPPPTSQVKIKSGGRCCAAIHDSRPGSGLGSVAHSLYTWTDRGAWYAYRLDALRGGDCVLQDEQRLLPAAG